MERVAGRRADKSSLCMAQELRIKTGGPKTMTRMQNLLNEPSTTICTQPGVCRVTCKDALFVAHITEQGEINAWLKIKPVLCANHGNALTKKLKFKYKPKEEEFEGDTHPDDHWGSFLIDLYEKVIED